MGSLWLRPHQKQQTNMAIFAMWMFP
jgi:hypothetical protein